jgi:replicative DNA helicase
MGTRPYDETTQGSIEAGVIGACLVEPLNVVALMKEPVEIFTSIRNREIAQAMIDAWRSESDIDFLTISDAIAKRGTVVPSSELAKMANESLSLNFSGDLALLRGRHQRRKVMGVITKASLAIHDEWADPQEIAAQTIAELSGIQPDRETLKLFREVVEPLIAQAEVGVLPEMIPTGFCDLDTMLGGGLRRGTLTVIAARPSFGKSALTTQIAVNMAKAGKKVLVFPIEMSANSVVSRIMASESLIEPVLLRKGIADWSKVRQSVSKLNESHLWLEDDAGLTSQKAIAVARELSARLGGLDLVVVDYIQRFSDIPTDNRNQWLGKVTKSFTVLARQIECPVILVSQVNRGVETSSEKRPTLASLRDSGEIEQDADIVMMLYREWMYNKNADPHLAELIIAKQRDGPTGTVKLYWNDTAVRFDNLSTQY